MTCRRALLYTESVDASTSRHGSEFYRQQARACLWLAKLHFNPVHRATFLRLAWHWRMIARSPNLALSQPGDAAPRALEA